MKSGKAESRSAAARHLGVHRNTIANWLQLYEDGGIEALREIKDPGPDPGQQSIPPKVMEKLKKRLSKPEGFGSYKEIQQWLAEKHDLELPYSTVHGIVRYELEAKPKAPRPSHPKKSERKQVAFKKELPARIEAIQAEAERPVRLFCQDESRFGLMPVTRRRSQGAGSHVPA